MVDPEHKTPSEKNIRVEVTDKKVLGALDPERIPQGYGIVRIAPRFIAPERRPDKPEYVITNDTGDARLFFDPELRSMSSMELKEGKFEGFVSGLKDLPPEYQDAMSEAQIPDTIQTTKSTEGTELLFTVGTGTSEDPLRTVQRTVQTYHKDVFHLLHLALVRHAYVSDQPISLLMNNVLYTYTPKKGVAVEVEAAVTFRPPREDIAAIERDIDTNTPLLPIDTDYYKFITTHPSTPKDPVTWYREDYSSYGLRSAESAFNRVQDKLRKKVRKL